MSKATSAEWFDKSWNPISGRCPHKCTDLEGKEYCYMWRPGGIAKRFKKKHDHPLWLNDGLGCTKDILNHPPKSGKVLVGSSTDMFADSVPDEWIEDVFFKVHEKALFMFLTKNPYHYIQLVKQGIQLPVYSWFGTSYDGTPSNRDNIAKLKALRQTTMIGQEFTPKKFISFEPLLKEPPPYLDLMGIGWIIIGADSRKGKPKPTKEWADYLIAKARRVGAMVLVKDNYNYPEKIKEMP